MQVREAVAGDARPMAAVHVRSWKVAYAGQVPADYLEALSAEQREPMWRQTLSAAGRDNAALVLVEDGVVLGFAHVAPSRDPDADAHTGEVTSVYLDPDHWGRGGGRLLMDRTLARMRVAGFSCGTLWVLASNERARRFYEAGGWRPDGAEKTDGHWGFGLLEHRYRRQL